MPAPTNILKQRLARGEVVHGCWLGMADPYAAQIAATAGFDWLLIDGEHAPNDIRSILAQLAVIDRSASAPVVRLPDGDPVKIKQVLDIGAQSIVIPMVETAEQARDLVRATRYPPHGYRGVGSALARASQFSGVPDYLATAGGEICLILQIETRHGIANLASILEVDGVDGVFIGPSDLAADMGRLGQPGHPDVKAEVMHALGQIRAARRAAGILTTDDAYIAAAKAAGANFIGVGIDVTLYAAALRRLAAEHVRT